MKNIRKYMDNIAELMNDEIRERVHAEMAPCSDSAFLRTYLKYDPDFDSVIKQFDIDMTPEYWLIEEINGSRYETLLKADNQDDAIEAGQSIVDALTDHDRQKRDGIYIMQADTWTDDDTPENIVYPDDETGDTIHTIK